MIGSLWWWLIWVNIRFFVLNLKFSYELWYGMMWYVNNSLFDEWVLFLLWLKNMFGEWCIWDMIICLVLLMIKVLFGVIKGILFMNMFCFLMFLIDFVLVFLLILNMIRCSVIFSGVLYVRLCCIYFLMLNFGFFSLYFMNLRIVVLLKFLIGNIDWNMFLIFLLFNGMLVLFDCRNRL